MCYNCEEKYSPGHKCKSKFFLLVGDEDDSNTTILEELNIAEDSVVAGSSSIPEVSMHALSGYISPRTIRVKGTINNHYVNVLIDSGSTYNFIQERVVNQLGLSVSSVNPFKVYI